MPAKHRVKEYIKGAYYHVYNRGVEKRKVFLDQQDYTVFLSYLKTYLLPKDEDKLLKKLADPMIKSRKRDKLNKSLRLNNFANTVDLLVYCLMPNHFHFLIKQLDDYSLAKIMGSLGTRYSVYFNRKYERVGSLFQDTYKAVLIRTDEQLLHLSRYIHSQAFGLSFQGQSLQKPQPSSFPNYLGKIKQRWVKPDEVLSFFKSYGPSAFEETSSYQFFVEKCRDSANEIIAKLLLE